MEDPRVQEAIQNLQTGHATEEDARIAFNAGYKGGPNTQAYYKELGLLDPPQDVAKPNLFEQNAGPVDFNKWQGNNLTPTMTADGKFVACVIISKRHAGRCRQFYFILEQSTVFSCGAAFKFLFQYKLTYLRISGGVGIVGHRCSDFVRILTVLLIHFYPACLCTFRHFIGRAVRNVGDGSTGCSNTCNLF